MKKILLVLCLFFSLISTIKAEDTTLKNNDQESQTNYKQESTTNNNQDEQSSTTKEKNSNPSSEDNELNLAENAKSAIMIEASTGKIIFEKNKDEKLPMASMTKMMTLLLIMENIENGNLKWDEKVTASQYASSMGGSQIFLEPGEEMTVEDLVKGICIGSGNDAAVAMAERIGGTEKEFVKMMNKKTKELGLKNTNFVNACGLDDDNHYSSAYDMAMIAKELVKHEKILEYTGTYEDYLRKDTDNSFWLVNTNKLVRYYQGVDGLKTGFTETAGYCITTTAKKNNMRLITVVMNEPSSSIRNAETTSMLDYGFNTYQIDTIISKKDIISKQEVELGTIKKVEVIPKEDVNILNTKTGTKRNVTYKVKLDTIKAPVKKGDIVGKISVIENNKTIMTIDATVNQTVKKANILTVYLRDVLDIIKGNI